MTEAPDDRLPDLRGPFTFEEPSIEDSKVVLRYRIGEDLRFAETVDFPFDLPRSGALDRAVHVLHLVAGVSYYKCVAPTELVMPAMTADERVLVERLYDDGLREFAYRNSLTVPLRVDITSPGVVDVTPSPDLGDGAPREGALVPVGGGKDSALVAALVPEGRLLAVNPVGAHDVLAEALGRPLLGVRRTLDPQLRELVARGVPNGHVPVTAITSAISVVGAVALGLADVVMGIERSADEPSLVTADGVEVNHQFSKSHEAELLLRRVFAPVGVRYFSLLRPLTELAIGAAVARRGLNEHIVSCNRVYTVWNDNTSSREQRACGECAKCLFTALMIAPSTSPEAIARQYGRPLLDEAGHVEDTRELWSDQKPFDCVGERLESAAAVVLLARTAGWRDQVVVRELADEAEALLRGAGTEPAAFLALEGVEALPEPYGELIAGLAPDLAAVPGLDAAR